MCASAKFGFNRPGSCLNRTVGVIFSKNTRFSHFSHTIFQFRLSNPQRVRDFHVFHLWLKNQLAALRRCLNRTVGVMFVRRAVWLAVKKDGNNSKKSCTATWKRRRTNSCRTFGALFTRQVCTDSVR